MSYLDDLVSDLKDEIEATVERADCEHDLRRAAETQLADLQKYVATMEDKDRLLTGERAAMQAEKKLAEERDKTARVISALHGSIACEQRCTQRVRDELIAAESRAAGLQVELDASRRQVVDAIFIRSRLISERDQARIDLALASGCDMPAIRGSLLLVVDLAQDALNHMK